MWKRLSRSELLSTFFPTWVWQGRMWSTWRIPKYDPYYWINAHSHPVISTYYPPSAFCSYISATKNIGLDLLFQLNIYLILLHVSFGILGWFTLIHTWSNSLVAIFGALTFTLAGYNWKQQPCSQYTFAWFPWLLYGIATGNYWLAGVASGMVYLAGYYPIGIQILAVASLATFAWSPYPTTWLWVPIGLLIGSPQLVPFLRYLPKTIRTKAVSDIGKVPWWHFASLVFPKAFRYSINGVGYWEMSYYVGLIPLFTIWYTRSRAVWLGVLSVLLMLGCLRKYLPRVAARFSYTFQFGLIWSALTGLHNLGLPDHVLAVLCLIQAFDLWHNNSPLLVNHPYAELYHKPSWAFNTKLTRYLEANLGDNRVSGLPYPLFTGHINKLKTIGYSGGMQLKLMAKWRHDECSDGSGQHDFFKGDGNPDGLDIARVKYSVTSTKLDWKHTEVSNLYLNPSFNVC